MASDRSLLHLQALPSVGIQRLLARTRAVSAGDLPRLSARAPIALLCGRPSPYVRAMVEGGAALLGLRVTTYGPAEVSTLGDATLAGARLSQVHPAILGVGLPSGTLAALAGGATVPVINAGDDTGDPIGALADLHLLGEWFGSLAGRRLTWVGDASGLLYDLLGGCGLGLSVAVAHPVGFAPDPERVTWARERAAEAGALVLVTNEMVEAMADASVVYVETWPADHVDRFRSYAVQRHTLRDARGGAVVLHRRPEHRGAELSASFAEEIAAHAVRQQRARVDACAAVLASALRADPLVSVVG